jgi:hypothetical protein
LGTKRLADADPHEEFVVVSPPGSAAARLLDLIGAERVLSIYPTRQTALAAVAGRAIPTTGKPSRELATSS